MRIGREIAARDTVVQGLELDGEASFFFFFFFFIRGGSRRTPKLSLDLSGGGTYYSKDQKENRNYTQVLTICTDDPKQILENAIGSSSFSSTLEHRSTANRIATGDETTWGGAAGARRTGARRPPYWHSSLEVEYRLMTPAGGNRSRRQRREGSPFDRQRRQLKRNCRECPPRRSSRAPLPQTRVAAAQQHEPHLLRITMSKEEEPHTWNTMNESAKMSFIDGGAGRASPHHHRLRPPELRDEENRHQPGQDPARRIRPPPPGIEPTTSIKPKTSSLRRHPRCTRTTATMYSPNSGASPIPFPTGYSGGEGIGLARSPAVDSQGKGGTRDFSLEKEEVAVEF